jgi:hypothetical protein
MARPISPYLELDELRRGRNKAVADAASGLGRVFGDAPLTLQTLQRADEDRRLRMADAATDRAAKAEDRGFAKAERERAARERNAKTVVGAGLAEGKSLYDLGEQPKPLPEGVEGPLPEPKVNPEIAAEYGKQELDQDAKRATIANKDSMSRVREKLAELKAAGAISNEEYKHAMVGLGWANHNLREKQGNARLEQGAQRLELASDKMEMQNLPPKLQGELAELEESATLLNDLTDYQTATQVDTGPLAGLVMWARQRAHIQDPKEANFVAMTDNVVNKIISDFGGKAVTAQELRRIMTTVPSGYDDEQVWQYLITQMKARVAAKHNAIVSSQSRMPGRKWVPEALGTRDKVTGNVTPPAVSTAPPPPAGKMRIRRNDTGKVGFLPAAQAQAAIAAGIATEVK